MKYDDFISFEHFLTEVRRRAESCNFKEKDRMIRDKIVLRTSGKLQGLLLREEKLELDKCLQTCRAFEQSNRHVQEIKQDKVHDSVNKVDNASPRSQAGASGTGLVRPKLKCGFCGLFHERSKEKCPAW